MTNEELAIEIQNGNKAACTELWEQVKYWVIKCAYSYYNKLKQLDREYIPDVEDFASEGYIAMLEAVKYYSPEKGYKYITYLGKTLKKAFATVAGLRTSRNEPLNNANSLNSPIGIESEDTEAIDMLSDETAQDDFQKIELSDTQQIFAAALANLSETDRKLIKLRYWDELSYTAIGKKIGITKSTVIARERKLLRKFRLNDSITALYNA